MRAGGAKEQVGWMLQTLEDWSVFCHLPSSVASLPAIYFWQIVLMNNHEQRQAKKFLICHKE